MSDKTRMQMLEEAYALITAYTSNDTWRPGLVDLFVYSELIDMMESDMDSPEWTEYLWKKTPDEIMQHVLDTGHIFDSGLEFGADQLNEEIRDYLIEQDFIVSIDDVDDEEYQQLTEGAN